MPRSEKGATPVGKEGEHLGGPYKRLSKGGKHFRITKIEKGGKQENSVEQETIK